jgi:hypothetical protein
VHTSIYVPRPVSQKLCEIAFTQECKVHDITMEGIDAALQKYGHPKVVALNGMKLKKLAKLSLDVVFKTRATNGRAAMSV